MAFFFLEFRLLLPDYFFYFLEEVLLLVGVELLEE